MTKQEIGAILMRLRENAGKSREEVAELLGKSIKTVGHWETGYAQPDANTLFLLCTIYGADLNESFGFGGKRKAPSVSDEAMKIAKDYDGLDSWGQKAVRKVTDVEMQRVSDSRVLRIAGRDGSYEEVRLTNEQIAKVIEQINQLPDASDDL